MGYWVYFDNLPSGGGGGGGGGCGTGCGCIVAIIVFALILKYGGSFLFAVIAGLIVGGVVFNWANDL